MCVAKSACTGVVYDRIIYILYLSIQIELSEFALLPILFFKLMYTSIRNLH